MISSRKNLFFISADHFQAYSWKNGELSSAQFFSNDAKGRDQFADFLKNNRHPSYLLTDVIEEDFRQESIPHLVGSNRRALISRKFDQYYRGTPFLQAHLLHRQAEGRRDDDMLFSSLTNPARISPWLDTMLSNQTALVGIYSVPTISTPLIQNIESEHVLLLTWEMHAGLRQTYFKNGRLHFSRLTPLSDNLSFSGAIVAETPRTQQYLKSLSLPPPGETLDVHIICDSQDRRALESEVHSSNELQYHYLDIRDLCKRLKSKGTPNSSDATPLFLQLLAAKPPGNQYANADHTHFSRLRQLRFILYGLAIANILIASVWTGSALLDGLNYSSESEPILNEASLLTRKANSIQTQFPKTSVPAADMKTAVTLIRKLNSYSPHPEKILTGLTQSLDQFTRVRTVKLAWQNSPADAAPSSYPAQVISYDGELLDFGSNYRGALTYLERFEQSLTQHGYTIASSTLPVDVSSKGSISNTSGLDASKPAQFSVKIVWREKE